MSGAFELPRYTDDDYIICVTAEDKSGLQPGDSWIDRPEVRMTWMVKRSYYSDTDLEERRPARDHYKGHVFRNQLSSSEITQDPLRHAVGEIAFLGMINVKQIPYPLHGDRLRWKDPAGTTTDDQASRLTPLESVLVMVDKICGVVNGTFLSGRGKLDIVVTVDKQITLSHQQYEAFSASIGPYLRQLDHEGQLELARLMMLNDSLIVVDDLNHEDEALADNDEAVYFYSRSKPATKASIETLDKFRLMFDDHGHDDDDMCKMETETKTCPICREEMLTGSEVIRMPCFHIFHTDCALKWLIIRHTCPLCRFELPAEDHAS